MAHSAIWGYLVKWKLKAKQKFWTVQIFFESNVRKHSKFGSPAVNSVWDERFYLFSILQIWLDDVISRKSIFAHLTKTKA